MNAFFSILIHDYRRTRSRLVSVVIMTLMMIASVFAAVHITRISRTAGRVAWVTSADSRLVPAHAPWIVVTPVPLPPAPSALYMQRYDAVAYAAPGGRLVVHTLRNDAFRDMIVHALSDSSYASAVPEHAAGRNAGITITGFLLVFLLMQAFGNLFVFADDKEQGQLLRIETTPVSYTVYIGAHCFYSLSLLLPAWIMLALLQLSGADIGFSLGWYALLISVTGFLGIAYALFLNAVIKKPDNATMFANASILLTSLIAGSFYASPRPDSFFTSVVKVLPQKAVLDFCHALADGSAVQHGGRIIYPVVAAGAMTVMSGLWIRLHRAR
jgi:ABC-2 type transport system permease protein